MLLISKISYIPSVYTKNSRQNNSHGLSFKGKSDTFELSKHCPIEGVNLYPKLKECKRYKKYKSSKDRYVENSGYDNTRIKDKFNPYTLPVRSFPAKTLHISNFHLPYGTIAIAGKLDETFSTNGLLFLQGAGGCF